MDSVNSTLYYDAGNVSRVINLVHISTILEVGVSAQRGICGLFKHLPFDCLQLLILLLVMLLLSLFNNGRRVFKIS